MKRDCGQGELIPIAYMVIWDSGMNDDETEDKFSNLVLANLHFESKRAELSQTNCSSVRLYAIDKQKYCNCIKMWIRDYKGEVIETNRFSEL